jgi:hypothetical protein
MKSRPINNWRSTSLIDSVFFIALFAVYLGALALCWICRQFSQRSKQT